MVSRTQLWSLQRLCRCIEWYPCFLGTINAAGMNETHGTYVDHECFDIHGDDDDADHDTDDETDDETNDDTNDDADDDSGICIYSRLKEQRPCLGTNEHTGILLYCNIASVQT